MNKLTIEHLAPYLPYGIKVKCADTGEMMKMDGLSGNSTMEVVTGEEMCRLLAIDKYYDSEEYGIPYLRPLSQITQEIEHNGERFIPIDYINGEFAGKIPRKIEWNRSIKNENLHFVLAEWISPKQLYGLFQLLFSWHFDVFGLIEQNLAIAYE